PSGDKLPLHEFGSDRQFGCSQTKCFLCHLRSHTFHLEQNCSGLHNGNPAFQRTLTRSHTYISGLLRVGLIRENTNPDFTTTLDVACHCNTGSLNLLVGNPSKRQRLQPILTERNRGTTRSKTFHLAAHL